MKSLRDARLQRALESAPDADVRPQAHTREAILAAARDAVHPAVQSEVQAPVREAWWKSWWRADRRTNMPWNAALATVAVATLVTTLWHDREIPGASTQKPAADSQSPAPVSTVPSPVSPAPARSASQVKARPAPQAPAVSAPAPAADAGSARSAESSGVMRDEQVRELAKSSPAAAAPAPAPLARSAPAAAARGGLQAAMDWSHARITVQGRTVEVSREQSGQLVRWLARIPRSEAAAGSLDSQVSERIELMQNGVTFEVIELAGDQLRWSRPPQSGITQPDRAVLQGLRDELGRLTPR